MSKVFTYIEVTFQFEAYHKWPEAPEQVFFLRNLHRHMFHGKAKIQVFDDNRELEFFIVKKFIQSNLDNVFVELGNTASCEMIARCIMSKLLREYGIRNMSISIYEDGENGATVSYNVGRKK